MKELTRNWIVSGVIFAVAVAFTVFCGLGIANMSRYEEPVVPETSTEAPSETGETPAPSTTEPVPVSTKAPSTTQEPTVAPSSDPNKSTGVIRLLSDEEIAVIYEKYPDVPDSYSVYGERDDLNRAESAVRYQTIFDNKFKRLYVFNAMKPSDVSLTFILTHEYGHTGKVLDVLKEHGVRATFFVTWEYLDANPELIERILLEKHELGTMGASNPEDGIGLYGLNDVMNDLMSMNEHVQELYNLTMTKLYYNHCKFKDSTLALATQMGYEIIFYSAFYEDDDPSKTIDTAAFLQSLELQVHRGAIYQLHTANPATAEVLPAFLSYLSSNNYTVGLID